MQTADRIGIEPVIEQLEARAVAADAKIELLGKVLRKMRGETDEEEFLLHGERIGGYLTGLRGLAFEQGHRDWCRRSAAVLRERMNRAER